MTAPSRPPLPPARVQPTPAPAAPAPAPHAVAPAAFSWAPFQQFVHGLLTRNALVTLARDFVAGRRAVRVAMRGIANLFSVDLAAPVLTPRAHAPYRLSGWVRTEVPGQTMCLRIEEVTAGNKLVRSTESCFTPTARWHRFSVRSRSVAKGHRLLVSAYDFGAERGDSFEIGGVSVSGR